MNNNTSNRLPVLQAQIREMHAAVACFEGEAARAALGAGQMLVEAKALCPHGTWLDWLKDAGVHPRTAQRYMLLHRAGFKSDTVSYFGLAEAEHYATTGLKLFPKAGHITMGSGEKANGDVFIYHVWRHTHELAGYWFASAGPKSGITGTTDRRPICLWGLGAVHCIVTADATRLFEPSEAPCSDIPQDMVDLLTTFTSLEPW